MLSSVLLHLGAGGLADPALDRGVELARSKAARVRGLTFVDTRRLTALCAREGAAAAASEADRLDRLQFEQSSLQQRLTQACLAAGVPCDVRHVRGNPCEHLTQEARFHDLVVTACPPPGPSKCSDAGLSPRELINLLELGVQPLLVLRDAGRELDRVLLVGDGSPASWRALRQFLGQQLLPHAVHRLLALGPTEAAARHTLAEMTAYCQQRLGSFEAGWMRTAWRTPLLPFARKWEADLVVLGMSPASFWQRRLCGSPAEVILRQTDLALYAAG